MAKKPTKSPTTRKPPRIAVVCSTYNATVTDALRHGAVHECEARTGETPAVFDASGAYELPALCMAAASSGRFEGIIALGCIIKGETSHDQYLAHAVADGLVNITIITGVPIAFGVLTTNNNAQALARAGGKKGNKGAEAASALFATLATMQSILNPSAQAAPAASLPPRPDKLRGKKSA